jgi:hypothetical protein
VGEPTVRPSGRTASTFHRRSRVAASGRRSVEASGTAARQTDPPVHHRELEVRTVTL